MSSGMGVRGTIGRCYGFFQDFLSCEAEMKRQIMTGNADGQKVSNCFEQREDYFECLHSRKEYARIKTVLDEKKRQGL